MSSDSYVSPAGSYSSLVPLGPTGANASATISHSLSHLMIRIKDPKVSIPFYTEVLGMTLVHVMDFPQWGFTNYFLCFPSGPVPSIESDRLAWMWSKSANTLLELCHNYKTETEDMSYKSGNEPEHRGFGHYCILVDDLHKACDRFTSLGVKFFKRPEDGLMKTIAFILDPDGYRIEIVQIGTNKF